MSIESGSVSFRLFSKAQPLPANAIEKFAARAAPDLSTLKDVPMHGWVTGRHITDNLITPETAYYAGYLRLALLKAERKIPGELLRDECRREELARMQAEGRAELDRRTRSEIRKEITDRLLPTMPPTLKAMGFVTCTADKTVICEAVSDKQYDAFEVAMRETFGFGLVALNPAHAAGLYHNLDIREVAPTSYSPDCEDGTALDNIGCDFLTWLWFVSETRGGIMRGPFGEFAVMVEGPLVFATLEGEGARVVALRQGTPELSAEAKVALLSGKKLARSKVLIARGNETWSVTLDADQFIFRGLRLPEGEKLDAASRFQERISMIRTFTDTFYGMYGLFLQERRSPATWAPVQKQIHAWVTERAARR